MSSIKDFCEEAQDCFEQINVYRKRNCNWVVVKHLTWHGCGYSHLICEYLGVDSTGYKWG